MPSKILKLKGVKVEHETMTTSLPAFFSHPDITPVILSFVYKPSLPVCLRVNRAFFDLVGPIVYHTVDISSDDRLVNVGTKQAESLVRRGPRPIHSFKSELLIHTRVATCYLDAWSTSKTPEISFALPNLRVLRVVFSSSSPSTRPNMMTRYASLLRRVRPRTLVVSAGFSQADFLTRSTPVVTEEPVHQVELVISLTTWHTLMPLEDMVTGRHLVVERAVVVFAPESHFHNDFRLSDFWSPRGIHDQLDWTRDRSRMFAALTTLCRITTGTVTLVNTSCFDRKWLGCPPNISTSDHFESELRKSIDSATTIDPAAEPKSVQGSLEFMGVREYLGSRHWAREFTRAEVRAWLE